MFVVAIITVHSGHVQLHLRIVDIQRIAMLSQRHHASRNRRKHIHNVIDMTPIHMTVMYNSMTHFPNVTRPSIATIQEEDPMKSKENKDQARGWSVLNKQNHA